MAKENGSDGYKSSKVEVVKQDEKRSFDVDSSFPSTKENGSGEKVTKVLAHSMYGVMSRSEVREKYKPKALWGEPEKEECLALGCEARVPRIALMCPAHWERLPRKLRDEVLASPENDLVLTRAQLVVAEAEGKLLQASFLRAELAKMGGKQ